MTDHVALPVGPEPNWELKTENGPPLRSIAESGVILQSLRRSREKWLTCAFAKFSARAKGKQPEVVAPPHTLTTLGRCNLHIGPLTFFDTSFFNVQFHQPVYGAGPSGAFVPACAPSTSTTASPSAPALAILPTPLPFQHAAPVVPSPPLLASAATAAASSDSPISQAQTTLDPRFLAHIYTTAATSPQLRELLNLSIAGRASAEQRHTLGVILHDLAAKQYGPAGAPPVAIAGVAPVQAQPLVPGVPPELVLEFKERMGERWILPRHLAVCERREKGGGEFDVLIRTALFVAPVDGDAMEEGPEARKPQIVELRLSKASHGTWDFVRRWAGEDDAAENKRALDKLSAETPRQYLQHRLPDGPLLDTLKNLNHPPLPLRSLDPAGHPPAPRRKPAARKPSAALSTMGPPELPASAATPSTSSDVPKAKTTTKGKQRVHPAADATDGAAQPPPAKRRRASQKELKRPAVIACQTCGNTDVPLLLGGQYCRGCIEQGRAPPQPVVYAQQAQLPLQASSGTSKP